VIGVPVRQGTKNQTRLVLLCGLPASGKTTLARELADAYHAVRLNPDEWELALGVDPFDEGFQAKLEAAFWQLTQRLLVLGTSVVLEWGFWARSERDEKREAARALGVAVELRFLEAPHEELVSRVVARHAAGGIAITESHMERYRRIFERPTDEELSLYDPALQEGASPRHEMWTITRRQSWVEGALESADPDLDRLLAGPMLEGVPELSSRA